MSHDLTPRQCRAVEHLAAGEAIGVTAAAVGVHRRTLLRWKELPAFVDAVEAAVLELTDVHRAGARAMLAEALTATRDAIGRGDSALAGRMLASPHLAAFAFGEGKAGVVRHHVDGPAVVNPNVPPVVLRMVYDDGEGE